MESKLAEKRTTIEKNRALKKALQDKALAAVCEDNGLPGCLAPFVKFNKCSIALIAKDTEAIMEMCRFIISNQNDFVSPLSNARSDMMKR